MAFIGAFLGAIAGIILLGIISINSKDEDE